MSQFCGIPAVDGLYSGESTRPIGPGDDPEAVRAVQDLLCGHGYGGMPSVTSPAYGIFGPKTTAALKQFQAAQGLTASGVADGETLAGLVTKPAADARASHVYIALALGLPTSPLQRVISLVAQMEGLGRFAALNLNTDAAGLSFGIIQWAQRPGRLCELLTMCHAGNSREFDRIFGSGDSEVAGRLLAHTQKPGGGVDSQGETSDPALDLIREPWVSRFREAGRSAVFQTVQVQAALQAFQQSLRAIRNAAPEAITERGIAFLLDVANQFGNSGMGQLCGRFRRNGIAESDLLRAVADETVRRMPPELQSGVRARRDLFLHTKLLSDKAF